MAVRIVISKSRKRLWVYQNARVILSTRAEHAGAKTRLGERKIVRWVWGAVASRKDFNPHTWFSFGDTFGKKHKRYTWPKPGQTGVVKCHRGTFKAVRISETLARVQWRGQWWEVWKDSNPYGVLAAQLTTLVWLHGTGRDKNGKDALGPGQAGCVKVSNSAIQRTKRIVPAGSIVSIEK